MDRSTLEEALTGLGTLLAERSEHYEIVTIGGSSLMLLGLGVRPTRDLDVVAIVAGGRYRSAEPMPVGLVSAAREIGRLLRIGDEWLNAGPTTLLGSGLPPGFAERVVTRRFGNLTVHLASRTDQIHLKLYACVHDVEGKHLADLRRLAPTQDELLAAGRWALEQDVSEPFRAGLLGTLEQLGVKDVPRRL